MAQPTRAPAPTPGEPPQITIGPDGSVSPPVTIDNGGVIRFVVSKYKPNTSRCTVTITSANVTFGTPPRPNGDTISVGS